MLREAIDRADKFSGRIGVSAVAASPTPSDQGIGLDLKRLSPAPTIDIGVPMVEFGCTSEPQTPSVRSDQRTEERKPVAITAAVLSQCRKKFTTATIVDRSERGAKIKIDRNISLPKVILLVDFQNGPVFECEVRWRQGCDLGVRIIDVYGPARRRRFFETSQLRNCRDFADPPPVR